MDADKPPFTAPAWVTRLDAKQLGEIPDGRKINLSSFRASAESLEPTFSHKTNLRARILLLLLSVLLALLSALGIWIFRGQLGIRPTAAARIAAGMVAVTSAMFLWGMYHVLVRDEKPRGVAASRHSLSDLYLAEYQANYKHRGRLSLTIFLLLLLAWAMPISGALVAIFGSSGLVRVTGLASGTGLGAVALFIRSTVFPMYRQAGDVIKQVLGQYGHELKSPKQINRK